MSTHYIDRLYANVTIMLGGNPKPFLDMWEKTEQASLMLTLGERDFGWAAVSKLLTQVSTIVGSSPVKSTVVPRLLHWVETGDMAFAAVLEKVEAVVPGRDPELHHYQRATLVFRRFDGEWKIIHYHNDTVSPQQEALSFILRHPHLDLEPA